MPSCIDSLVCAACRACCTQPVVLSLLCVLLRPALGQMTEEERQDVRKRTLARMKQLSLENLVDFTAEQARWVELFADFLCFLWLAFSLVEVPTLLRLLTAAGEPGGHHSRVGTVGVLFYLTLCVILCGVREPPVPFMFAVAGELAGLRSRAGTVGGMFGDFALAFCAVLFWSARPRSFPVFAAAGKPGGVQHPAGAVGAETLHAGVCAAAAGGAAHNPGAGMP